MTLEIQASSSQIQAVFNRFEKRREANQIIKKALNQTARQVAKDIVPMTRNVFTVKRSAFKNSDVKVTGATQGKLKASIKVDGEPQSPNKSFQSRKNSKRKAVKLKILRSGSMKAVQLDNSGSPVKAFLATMSNGEGKGAHSGIFQRVPGKYMNRGRVTDKGYSSSNTYKPRRLKNGRLTKGRESIKEIFTLANSKMVENQRVYDPWEKDTAKLLRENLIRFTDQALGGRA